MRLSGATLMSGVRLEPHSVVKDSVIGWNSTVGSWVWICDSVLAEDVTVKKTLILNGATVLPHKELSTSVRSPQIII